MNTFVKVTASSLPLIGSIIIGYFLYRSIPSSAMLIILMLIIFFGVISSFVLYQRLGKAENENWLEIDEGFFPELTDELIYIAPLDFSGKVELGSGTLWLVGLEEPIDLAIEKIEFTKLQDELIIKFKKGYTIDVTQIPTVAFDDSQFQIFGFKTLKFSKNNKIICQIEWHEDGPELENLSNEKMKIDLPSRLPVLVFNKA